MAAGASRPAPDASRAHNDPTPSPLLSNLFSPSRSAGGWLRSRLGAADTGFTAGGDASAGGGGSVRFLPDSPTTTAVTSMLNNGLQADNEVLFRHGRHPS
jgi:hypothetical protein